MIPNEKKNKHMTLQDRIEIQECLTKGMTFKAIAKRIGKNQTTVSREVKSHQKIHINGYVRTEEVCPKLMKAPFVCNSCEKKHRSSCPYRRQVYEAKNAQVEYEKERSEAREGVALNRESFYETERIISEAVMNHQHIYHAATTNKVPASVATIYRHIKKQYYRIGVLDLPRAVKFKERKSSPPEHVPASVRKDRTYGDFLTFIEDNPGIPVTELDTVIGKIGGKTIMTLHSASYDFMIGILLENKTAAEAAHKIQSLKQKLLDRGFRFGDFMPVLLTDNGGEFSCVSAFENDPDSNPDSLVFFCDPASPQQKPHIEKNHTLFREILPKGSSFDHLTQDDVNLVFSHVNAVKRKQFNGKSAFDLFTFAYSVDLANALGISFIPPEKVIQSPKLLK